MPGVLRGVKYRDPVTVFRGEKVLNIAKRLGLNEALRDLDLAIDFFYSLYLPVPIIKPFSAVEEGKERNYHIVRALLNNPVLNELKQYTTVNSSISTLLSASLMSRVADELEKEGSLGGENESDGRDVDEGTASRAVNRALKDVAEEAKAMKSLEKMMGYGKRAGSGTVLDLEDTGEDIIRMARSADVRKLLEIMSTIPSLDFKLKRKVYSSAKGEVIGYLIGSDIERVVPTELALPRVYFKTKLLEGRLLVYDKVLPKTPGPLYVLIDKSGSMEGEKIRWAKATAIALFLRSRREARDFYIRFFDGSAHPLIRVSRKTSAREVINLIDYLARVKGGGGTDITGAVLTACDDISRAGGRKPSDLIVITDGEDRIGISTIKRRLKQVNTRLVSVMIAGDNRDLREVSDKYMRVIRLSDREILQVVEA